MFFFKEKTAYEMRISDWSSDVCSSDLLQLAAVALKLELVAKKAAEAVNDDPIIRVVGIRRRLDHRPADRAAVVGRRRARLAVVLEARKSVVVGKSVSGGVSLGGRGLLQINIVTSRKKMCR